jgi:hypothetical protein
MKWMLKNDHSHILSRWRELICWRRQERYLAWMSRLELSVATLGTYLQKYPAGNQRSSNFTFFRIDLRGRSAPANRVDLGMKNGISRYTRSRPSIENDENVISHVGVVQVILVAG